MPLTALAGTALSVSEAERLWTALETLYQDDPAGRARAEAIDVTHVDLQAKAVAKAAPGARIVYLPHAQHLIYASNEAEVLHEMATFLDGLPGN